MKIKAERKERGKKEKRRRRISPRKTTSSDDEEERRVTRVRDDSLTPVKKECGKGKKRRWRSITKRMSSSEDEDDHRPMNEEGNMLIPVKKRRRMKPLSEEFETSFKKKRGKEKGDDNDTDISPANAKGEGVISSAEKANCGRGASRISMWGNMWNRGARTLHNKTDGVEWSLEDCRGILKLLENGIEPQRNNIEVSSEVIRTFTRREQVARLTSSPEEDDYNLDILKRRAKVTLNQLRANCCSLVQTFRISETYEPL